MLVVGIGFSTNMPCLRHFSERKFFGDNLSEINPSHGIYIVALNRRLIVYASRLRIKSKGVKKIFFVLFVAFLTSCGANTIVTGTWKSPNPPPKSYNTILVASLTSNVVAKSTIENNMAA